ncbi:MAG TPA: DNA polymerase I [Acholeplasma sp.]|nr:DNA polymerase I [Acholeplasma sp.]
MKRLILVDGNSILFRAYFATAYPGAELMKTSKGVYTNALFAFVNMFEKIVDNNYDDCLVAFDTKEKTKRHIMYEDYKAGRAQMPEELAQQIPLIHKYLELIGVKAYSKEGYEADDIIGTMAKRSNLPVDIYSSDRDLLQLVDDNITVHLLKKGMKEVHSFNPKSLKETYELDHHQMIDLKALMGDPSDNIPGIPGVGEKTAVKLLKEYGTLENILKVKHNIKGKLGEKIVEFEHLALLSKELVTIDVNGTLEITINDLKKQPVNEEELMKFFQEYELHSFAKKMDISQTKKVDWDFEIVEDEIRLSEILTNKMAIYFEFSDANYHKAELWGVGLSNGEKHYFLPSDFALNSLNFSIFLSDESIEKYTYDFKAIKVFLKWQKLSIENVTFDLLLGAYLIDSHLGKETFKNTVLHFDYDDVLYDDHVYGRGAKKAQGEKGIYEKHIVSKAKAIYDLRETVLKTLEEQEQLSLYKDIELPLSEVLALMEYEGISVDIEALNEASVSFKKEIDILEEKIIELAGKRFNVASPKQLGDVLFEDLKLPSGKKTKTGYSTNADVLNTLKTKHPIIPLILDYRQLTKLYSTYVLGLKDAIFEDGKIHTIYMQALTTTGRLSSIEPNLQNIPTRTELGRKIRKFFKASNGHMLLGADYSQIELRVLASMADVTKLKEAFLNDEDIHTKTAQEVFHVEDVSSEQRRQAKAVNFGIIYGIGAWSLAEDIDVSQKEAQNFIDRYLSIYPEIKKYMVDIVEYAKANGYVKTLFNRRRYIPELKSNVYAQRSFGERTALNTPIQGSAADILKKAMIDLFNYIKKNKKQSKILLQVHDELILEVPEDEINEMEEVVPKIMANAYKLSVPLVTSNALGKTWYDLE